MFLITLGIFPNNLFNSIFSLQSISHILGSRKKKIIEFNITDPFRERRILVNRKAQTVDRYRRST